MKLIFWMTMVFYKKTSFFLDVYKSNFLTNKLKHNRLILILMTSLISFPTIAQKLNDQEREQYIISSCNAFKNNTDTQQTSTLPCIIYIQGFFNGVINVGNIDVMKIDTSNNKSSSFVERAYANRVGNRGKRQSVKYSCIALDELKQRILKNLTEDSLVPFNDIKQVNQLLVNTLKSACSTDSKTK